MAFSVFHVLPASVAELGALGRLAVGYAMLEAGVNYSYEHAHPIITLEPGKRGGKPCIRGMRITVYDVLSYLAAGMTQQEILADFPSLTEQDILASLSDAADREQWTLVVQA